MLHRQGAPATSSLCVYRGLRNQLSAPPFACVAQLRPGVKRLHAEQIWATRETAACKKRGRRHREPPCRPSRPSPHAWAQTSQRACTQADPHTCICRSMLRCAGKHAERRSPTPDQIRTVRLSIMAFMHDHRSSPRCLEQCTELCICVRQFYRRMRRRNRAMFRSKSARAKVSKLAWSGAAAAVHRGRQRRGGRRRV